MFPVLPNRSDLKVLIVKYRFAYLKQESERQSLKPQFWYQVWAHVWFGGLPMQYTLMGMMKLPLQVVIKNEQG